MPFLRSFSAYLTTEYHTPPAMFIPMPSCGEHACRIASPSDPDASAHTECPASVGPVSSAPHHAMRLPQSAHAALTALTQWNWTWFIQKKPRTVAKTPLSTPTTVVVRAELYTVQKKSAKLRRTPRGAAEGHEEREEGVLRLSGRVPTPARPRLPRDQHEDAQEGQREKRVVLQKLRCRDAFLRPCESNPKPMVDWPADDHLPASRIHSGSAAACLAQSSGSAARGLTRGLDEEEVAGLEQAREEGADVAPGVEGKVSAGGHHAPRHYHGDGEGGAGRGRLAGHEGFEDEDDDGREALEGVVHGDIQRLQARQGEPGVGRVEEGDGEQVAGAVPVHALDLRAQQEARSQIGAARHASTMPGAPRPTWTTPANFSGNRMRTVTIICRNRSVVGNGNARTVALFTKFCTHAGGIHHAEPAPRGRRPGRGRAQPLDSMDAQLCDGAGMSAAAIHPCCPP